MSDFNAKVNVAKRLNHTFLECFEKRAAERKVLKQVCADLPTNLAVEISLSSAIPQIFLFRPSVGIILLLFWPFSRVRSRDVYHLVGRSRERGLWMKK